MLFARSSKGRQFLARPFLATALLLVTVGGTAQDTATGLPVPSPAPAPSGGVSGPPDGRIPPAPVERGPRPLPPQVIVTPTPAPAPTPSPTPVQRTAPTPSQTVPPRATGSARDTPRQAPRQAPQVAVPVEDAGPVMTQPTAPPTDAPFAVPATPDASLPDASLPDPSLPDAASPDIASPAAGGRSDWWPYAAGAALLALLGGVLLFRRRAAPATQSWPDERPAPPRPQPSATAGAVAKSGAKSGAKSRPQPKRAKPAGAPAAAASDTPTSDRAPGRAPGRRSGADWLDIALEPVSANSTLVNFRLRYRVHLTNRADEAITGGKLRVQLLSGPQAAEAVIRHWFASDLAVMRHDMPVIAPGETAVLTGELVVALAQLHPLAIEGRTLVVPVIGAAARFDQPSGMEQCARAFVIGREPVVSAREPVVSAREPVVSGREPAPNSHKLAPFRLDRGPANYAPLGSRDTGIADIG